MARKVVSRKQKREEAEAAEALEAAEGKTKKKKKAKRKSRKKEPVEVRMKVYWGVFNHAMKRVALYEFNQKKAAQKKAKDLNVEGKPPHFVAKVKQEVEA